MNAQPIEPRPSLMSMVLATGTRGSVSDESHCVELAALASHSGFETPLDELQAKSVLIACGQQLSTLLAVIALDGLARRIILALPDIEHGAWSSVVTTGEVDCVVYDDPQTSRLSERPSYLCNVDGLQSSREAPRGGLDTEWVLMTSGTTGIPKMVVHSRASLVGPLTDAVSGPQAVWSTFYDIRRYGGLQILLRALLGGGSLILSSRHGDVTEHLDRAGRKGLTHISGTPSHWRKVLMSGKASSIAPKYVRLSGEIADQAILDRLHATYPMAEIAHAFASTEAGVAFAVTDGLTGVPADVLLGPPQAGVQLRLVKGSLCIRSSRTASRYLGAAKPLRDEKGFVDTGDLLQRIGNRYFFKGRREGVINVGGQKVFPEEVESVLARHPSVRASRVYGRSSPVVGALVTADVVIAGGAGLSGDPLRQLLLAHCRATLPPYKVPAILRFVPELEIAPSGKVSRRHG